MVLSFALCASFAFAQTNKSITVSKDMVVDRNVATQSENVAQKAGYTGSIFTKDGEIFLCTFAQEGVGYTADAVHAGEQVNGTNIVAHAQTKAHSQWHRLPSNVLSQIEAVSFFGATEYPASYDVWGSYICGANPNNIPLFGSTTANEGIMVMSMQDQISAWGGSGTVGAFDAYMRFDNINTTGQPLVRVRFYQHYRKFNYDECWIDYSTDGGNTWGGVEINIRGVDVDGNSWAPFGWKTTTMPTSIGNQSNVSLRLRWTSSNNGGGAYGYIWFVDDFQVIPAPDNSLAIKSNQYYEGFYQMMPQNLTVPTVWVSSFINDGKNSQTNFTGHIYTYPSGQAATELTSKNIGTVVSAPFDTRSIVVDPLGWYDSLYDRHGWGYQDSNFATGPYASLPTASTGTYHFFSDLTSDHYSVHLYGDTSTFDTLRYDVNWHTEGDSPYGVWARDNGALRRFSYYAAGLVSENTFSTDPDETMWNKAGYGVLVSYVTGDQIPTDAEGKPWRILGMELVAATQVGRQAVGSRLEPVLFRDSTYGNYVSFFYQDHGAGTHVVQANEVISNQELNASGDNAFTYELNGNYPTVKIMFPNQPVLRPNSAYRVGYELAEDADFAVACNSNYYYDGDTNAIGYYEEDGMASYSHTLPISNRYTVMVLDAYDGGAHWFSTSQYPMIRLLVGPYHFIPKVAVHLECDNEDYGSFMDGNYNVLCDYVDSIVEGASTSYIVMPAPGYVIDQILYNGQPVEWSEREDEDGAKYGVVTIENVTAEATLKCFFKEAPIGFDPVANVSMKLQPNPATSNVNIVMKGVTGTVNMALIDMSGRVVTTSKFNAENGYNLNVSNLAKGAYFVRITNDKFNKIEKLIVR